MYSFTWQQRVMLSAQFNMLRLPVVRVRRPTCSTACVGQCGTASSSQATWAWPGWSDATSLAACRCRSTLTAPRARCSCRPRQPGLDAGSPAICSSSPSDDWSVPTPDQHTQCYFIIPFDNLLFHKSFPPQFFYLSIHWTHSTDSSCYDCHHDYVASDSCLMLDCVCVINFLLFLLIIIIIITNSLTNTV